MPNLLNKIYYNGPQSFTKKAIANEPDIFKQRTALLYTPTNRLPAQWIGTGSLDIVLPIASPTIYDYCENMAYRVPRLWVDLIQRATHKLRWTPLTPAKVIMIRYDAYEYSYVDLMGGAKAILDALKYKTAGRSDGKNLYYFGAIQDDNQRHLVDYQVKQVVIDNPSQASLRIIVEGSHNHLLEATSYLPEGEEKLLARIKQGLPKTVRIRLDNLIKKRQAQRITENELQELKQLTHQIELSDAERLKDLLELSHLRDVPLDELIKQLGLKPHPHD